MNEHERNKNKPKTVNDVMGDIKGRSTRWEEEDLKNWKEGVITLEAMASTSTNMVTWPEGRA